MTYFDGFVIAVPTGNRQAFVDHANTADSMFIDYGALRVVECWADDVPDGRGGTIWRFTRKAMPTRLTLVNGVPTFENGAPTGEMPGRFLSPVANDTGVAVAAE